MQDAELKLFAEERPRDSAAEESSLPPSPASGGVVGGPARHSVSSDEGVGDAAVVVEKAGGEEGGAQSGEGGTPGSNDKGSGKKGKKKRGKRQPAVTQRGPLLITHTGEMHLGGV